MIIDLTRMLALGGRPHADRNRTPTTLKKKTSPALIEKQQIAPGEPRSAKNPPSGRRSLEPVLMDTSEGAATLSVGSAL
jgi:hypothetical protein